jgi:hypothetical protein
LEILFLGLPYEHLASDRCDVASAVNPHSAALSVVTCQGQPLQTFPAPLLCDLQFEAVCCLWNLGSHTN